MTKCLHAAPSATRCRPAAGQIGLLAFGAALLLATPALAEEDDAAAADPFYADRFVIPDDSDFLEENPEHEAATGAERLAGLERKDSSPWAPYRRAGAMALDAVLVRVPASGSLVVGSALFTASLPGAVASGMFDESVDVFVRSPYRFAITRSLGDFAD